MAWTKRPNGRHSAFVSSPRSRWTAAQSIPAPRFTSRSACLRGTYANCTHSVSARVVARDTTHFGRIHGVDGPRAGRGSDGQSWAGRGRRHRRPDERGGTSGARPIEDVSPVDGGIHPESGAG